MNATAIVGEARSAVLFLVQSGLADDQNLPFLRTTGKRQEITFDKAGVVTAALREMTYEQSFEVMEQERAFCARFLDGGMLQIMYELFDDTLLRQRLAYLPSPRLRQYSDDRDIYELDVVYADVVSKRIVPVPVRFDFDSENAKDLDHPMAHVTLGQYENCRVPATCAASPRQFVEFILNAFYRRGFVERMALFPNSLGMFTRCITVNESSVIHFGVPSVL